MTAHPEEFEPTGTGSEASHFLEPPFLVVDADAPDDVREQLVLCHARVSTCLQAGETDETVRRIAWATLTSTTYHRNFDFDAGTRRAIAQDDRVRSLEAKRRGSPHNAIELLRRVRERRIEILLERGRLAGQLGEISISAVE